MSTDHESDTKCICSSCIHDSYLQKEILDKGTTRVCSICDEEEWTFTLEEIADHVERAFREHYQITPDEPDGFEYAMQKETDYEWIRQGEEIKYILESLLGIDEELADEIRVILDDKFPGQHDWDMQVEGRFSSEARYEEKAASGHEYLNNWESLVKIVQTQARHFNPVVESILESIFGHLKDAALSAAITQVGPEHAIAKLYRTRFFENDEGVEEAIKRPDLLIGPPPPGIASAGRMNPQGISVFYGAKDLDTAIAEIRPPVGSMVVSGEFTILKRLRLLDLAAETKTYPEGSVFDPNYIKVLEKKKFLSHLSYIISRTVLPSIQAKEYLPTQVVAEYLANQIGLDGIIYSSAQAKTESSNVVIFQRNSKVEDIELPAGTELSANLYEQDEESSYLNPSVIEEVPKKIEKDSKEEPKECNLIGLQRPNIQEDFRTACLRINLESVKVHTVQKVNIDYDSNPVYRRRWTKQDTEDF